MIWDWEREREREREREIYTIFNWQKEIGGVVHRWSWRKQTQRNSSKYLETVEQNLPFFFFFSNFLSCGSKYIVKTLRTGEYDRQSQAWPTNFNGQDCSFTINKEGPSTQNSLYKMMKDKIIKNWLISIFNFTGKGNMAAIASFSLVRCQHNKMLMNSLQSS